MKMKPFLKTVAVAAGAGILASACTAVPHTHGAPVTPIPPAPVNPHTIQQLPAPLPLFADEYIPNRTNPWGKFSYAFHTHDPEGKIFNCDFKMNGPDGNPWNVDMRTFPSVDMDDADISVKIRNASSRVLGEFKIIDNPWTGNTFSTNTKVRFHKVDDLIEAGDMTPVIDYVGDQIKEAFQTNAPLENLGCILEKN